MLTPKQKHTSGHPLQPGNWTDFLGIVLLTGIMDKNKRIANYWRTKPSLQMSFFNQTMSRDRFQLKLPFLHFNNNDAMPSDCTDKLNKIQPVFETLLKNGRSVCCGTTHCD